MVICGNYMFEFSVGKDMKKTNYNDKSRILAYHLALCLILAFSIILNTNRQGVENWC